MIDPELIRREAEMMADLEKDIAHIDSIIENLKDRIDDLEGYKDIMRNRTGSKIRDMYDAASD